MVLFLVAIVIPSLVLVVLSLRMISQERELTEKRLLDERHRRTSEIRQELLTHLERIKLKQVRALATQTKGITKVDYGDPDLVFVGLVENNQLVLPWEQDPTADEFQQLLSEPAFAQRIQQASKRSLQRGNLVEPLLCIERLFASRVSRRKQLTLSFCSHARWQNQDNKAKRVSSTKRFLLCLPSWSMNRAFRFRFTPRDASSKLE